MADVQISEVEANFNQSMRVHEILYANRSSNDEQRLLTQFLYKKRERGSQLKVKTDILYYGDNSLTAAL
jgi:hypothetical protein